MPGVVAQGEHADHFIRIVVRCSLRVYPITMDSGERSPDLSGLLVRLPLELGKQADGGISQLRFCFPRSLAKGAGDTDLP